uniref:Uncharacterized protein n=1 Tax=Meloidogyne enterolobii TaxID=390850 RepID=A0A6V7WB72_MELEN|nr:unnamed protein product [Meloidogyne enterolobii]
MNKLTVDNDKNLVNIPNNFDQKIKLLQQEITNKETEKFQNLEQKYIKNYQSLELKIQEIKEENKDKITNFEQIIQQKDVKINLLEGEVKKQMSDIQRDQYKHLLKFQNEIKEIKTENEANIKILKQKNKEKYQQLEKENKNKISNLEEIISEKEVKITSMEKDIKECMNKLEVDTDQKIKLFQKEVTNKLEQKYKENCQSLELKIQKIEEENKNKIINLERIIQQKDEKINLLEGEVKKAEETINALNKKIDNLTEEQEHLFNVIIKKPKYTQIKNKWKYFDNIRKCCEDNCVNTNTPIGKCKNGNGFVEIINDTDIKYNKCIEAGKGENRNAQLDAENKFYKPNTDCNFASLFYYYEIKLKKEGPEYSWVGFRDSKGYILLGDNGLIYYSPTPNTAGISFKILSFSWNDGDIFGCGLVFPPTKMLEKHPYVFFTQNGNQIGKAILLKEESDDYYELYLSLKSHSIETNFSNDLDANPFCFDISKHLFAEEFYN